MGRNFSINEKDVESCVSYFRNGEMKLTLPDFSDYTQLRVFWRYSGDDSSIVKLFFVMNHLKNQYADKDVILTIPYLPFSRMDRVHSTATEVFTLRYFADLVNSFKCKKVVTYEVHSDVACALIDHLETRPYTVPLFKLILGGSADNVAVCFPDVGAQKRYSSDLKRLVPGVSQINACYKERDWSTGEITKLDLYGQSVEGKDIYILDDLCATGNTLHMVAEKLKEAGARTISVVVTHLEKPDYSSPLFSDGIVSRVYCSDSIGDYEYDNCAKLTQKEID